jgi:hypothetical protein
VLSDWYIYTCDLYKGFYDHNSTPNWRSKMTMTTGTERAALAYKLALQITDGVLRMKEEFPSASKKLEEVVRLLVSEGTKAEVERK